MNCPVPELRFEVINGVRRRLKIFRETAEWTMGDLLEIDGRPTLFLNVTLCDEEIPGSHRWKNIGGYVMVADELGFREMTTEEFDAVSDLIHIVTKFNDLA